ncbi:MAG TPA: hypothetical protein PKC55_17990 [Dysgonomonas sp.]|uniref:hypothetical protein n=1 Tax=unclassified Dysgonomonas TaxID=2630389 RepID=UPI0025C2DE05|nr:MULTISPECIES: hypothetical protein [unclassified Dysgonomonas]HML66720.1 hypothetical protein [Dysgonomonas sp.]
MNLNEIIVRLEQVDYSRDTDAEVVEILLNMYGKPIPAPIIDIPAGKYILRARNVADYNEVSVPLDLSYNRNSAYYGRANKPNSPIFYGSYFNSTYEKTVGTCLLETCPLFRNQNPIEKEYKTIIGEWEVIEPISVFTIINPHPDGNRSDFLNYLSAHFPGFIEQFRGVFDKKEIISFQEYLYHKFNEFNITEDPKKYWITSNFAQTIILPDEIDGIIYESTRAWDPNLKDAVCITLKPNSADDKLRFIRAIRRTYEYKNGESDLIETEIHPMNI